MEQYRKTPRANFLDYDDGMYFVTICTRNREHWFGEIIDDEMQFTQIGEFAHEQLSKAKDFNANIEVPLFVVMPNHIHAIVAVEDSSDEDMPAEQRSPNPSLRAFATCQRHVPTLSRYINSFKGTVTKFASSINKEFSWQGRYHDHYIRGVKDGNNIADYIENNVARWANDCFNIK